MEREWEDYLADALREESELWDKAEALSDDAGYVYKDRYGCWRNPNPARQQGLVELALQIYTAGVGWLGWADVGGDRLGLAGESWDGLGCGVAG